MQKYDKEVVIPARVSIYKTRKEEESAQGPGTDTETEDENEGNMDDDQNSNDIFGDLRESEDERMRNVVKMELAAYRRSHFPTTASPTEGLIWLRKQSITFPNVTSLTRHNLGIPPTQIENERVFSLTGRISTPLRNRICTSVFDQLVSISKNYPCFENIENKDVSKICSMKEFWDFLITAEELDEALGLPKPLLNSSLGVNDAAYFRL